MNRQESNDDIPVWGSPDDSPPAPRPGPRDGPSTNDNIHQPPTDNNVPVYGTPSSPGSSPATLSGPPPATPGCPAVLTAATVVVVEQAGLFSAGGYALTTADDIPLGSLVQDSSAAGWLLGGAANTAFRLLDTRGEVIGTMQRPGTLGRSRFVVSDYYGAQVGTIEQENHFGAPQFLITTTDGLRMTLRGGQLGSREWELVDGLDPSVLMGVISQEYAGLRGMINDTQRFAVQLSPQLLGGHRLLATMAAICLDYVRDAKRR